MTFQFRWGWALLALFAVSGLVVSGCDRKPSGAHKNSGPALKSPPQATANAKAEAKSRATAEAASPMPASAAQASAPKSLAATATLPAGTTAAKVAPVAAADSKSGAVGAEACQRACSNVLSISLADMGKTPPKVRSAIEKRVKADCPKQCVKQGTLATVRCFEKAKTATELAACPR